jgi:hypothetical protein
MITILIFDAKSPGNITFCADGMKLAPTDEARESWKHIKSHPNPIIRCYTDVLPNMLGAAIEYKLIDRNDVRVIHPNGETYHYNERGCMVDDWPWGTFLNNFDPVDYEKSRNVAE